MSIIFHGENPVWDEEYGPAPIRVMSTFSGIGAASISWRANESVLTEAGKVPLFDFVAYAEIEPFPCHVLHYRRGTSRPKYMPDPLQEGIDDEEKKEREDNIRDVSRLPDTGVVNFGDITQITDDDLHRLGHVDVLEGGSPCQAFSVAGARQGLNDPRGNLLLAFCRLAERMHTINGLQFVVWENVLGVLSDKSNGFGCLLASLSGEKGGALQRPGKRWENAGRVLGPDGRSVTWRTVQASHWGIPQKRKRVFVVANLGTGSGGLGSAAPESVLFESEGSFWHLKQGLKTRQAVVSTYRRGDRLEYRSAEARYKDPKVRARLKAESSKEWIGAGLTAEDACIAIDMKSKPYASETAYALTAQNEGNPQAVAYALADDYSPKASKGTAFALMAGSRSGGGRKQMVVHSTPSEALCLNEAAIEHIAGIATESDSVDLMQHEPATVVVSPVEAGTLYARAAPPIGKSSHQNFVVITKKEGDENPQNWIARYFTPLECERLQGFPDHWTDVPFKGDLVADGHRYKAIGNSMPCPVMAYIGHHLEATLDVDRILEANPDLLAMRRGRKRGRPPKNGSSAMTDTERQRQRRERLRQAASAAE